MSVNDLRKAPAGAKRAVFPVSHLREALDGLRGHHLFVLRALERVYPIGSTVRWHHGKHIVSGSVLGHHQHYDGRAMLTVQLRSGSTKVMSAESALRGAAL